MEEIKLIGMETNVYKEVFRDPTKELICEFNEGRMAFAMAAMLDKSTGMVITEIGIHTKTGESRMGLLVEGDPSTMVQSFIMDMTRSVAKGMPINAYHTMMEAWVTSLPSEEGEVAAVPDDREEAEAIIAKVRKHGTRSECIVVKTYAPGVGALQSIQHFGRGMDGSPVFTREPESFWDGKEDGGMGNVRDFSKELADKLVNN